jgi:hypothetical protein
MNTLDKIAVKKRKPNYYRNSGKVPWIFQFKIFQTFVLFLELFSKPLQITTLLKIVCIKRFLVIGIKSCGCINQMIRRKTWLQNVS